MLNNIHPIRLFWVNILPCINRRNYYRSTSCKFHLEQLSTQSDRVAVWVQWDLKGQPDHLETRVCFTCCSSEDVTGVSKWSGCHLSCVIFSWQPDHLDTVLVIHNYNTWNSFASCLCSCSDILCYLALCSDLIISAKQIESFDSESHSTN